MELPTEAVPHEILDALREKAIAIAQWKNECRIRKKPPQTEPMSAKDRKKAINSKSSYFCRYKMEAYEAQLKNAIHQIHAQIHSYRSELYSNLHFVEGLHLVERIVIAHQTLSDHEQKREEEEAKGSCLYDLMNQQTQSDGYEDSIFLPNSPQLSRCPGPQDTIQPWSNDDDIDTQVANYDPNGFDPERILEWEMDRPSIPRYPEPVPTCVANLAENSDSTSEGTSVSYLCLEEEIVRPKKVRYSPTFIQDTEPFVPDANIGPNREERGWT